MLLFDPLFTTAGRVPDRTALVDKSGRLTYGDLARAVESFASALRARGIAKGDRVAVFLPNVAQAAAAMYGILTAGAVFVPINPLTRPDKLALLLSDAGAVALVTSDALANTWVRALDQGFGQGPDPRSKQESAMRFVVTIDAGASQQACVPTIGWSDFLAVTGPVVRDDGLRDGDLAALIYTSGSTGEPKGVMLTHLNMLTVADSVTSYLSLTEQDVLYCALPLSFSYGICQLTTGLPVGATIVLDASFAFPVKSLALMAAERVTCFAGVPTMYALLAGLPDLGSHDLRSLRMCTNAADAIPEPLLATVRRAIPQARFFSMYGLTECQRVTYLPPEEIDRRPGSVGRGMPNQELWLVDEGGQRLPFGGTGELVVRGQHVMRGYWRKPEQSAERLRPGPDAGESVLHTGDIFRTDDDGFLYFVARKDDLIKSRGEKVSPREVENAICAVPGVAAVAVVGVRHAMLGQAIKAFVVRIPGAMLAERDVIRHCRERIESYMVPHEVTFVDELPTTLTGKVRRADLR